MLKPVQEGEDGAVMIDINDTMTEDDVIQKILEQC